MKILSQRIFVLLIILTLATTYGIVKAAGAWADDWADAPDWGYQNWYDYSTYVKWYPTFKWVDNSPPTSNRRIELEWYNPGAETDCNRLEPTSVVEVGGDFIDSWWTDNECGWNSEDERLVFTLKEQNISSGVYYQAKAQADIVSSPSTSGETNVSFTCWLCSDDWLGKQTYNSSYDDTGSSP